MFIQTETTPNPDTIKFFSGRVIMDKGTADFTSQDQAQVSPLARKLFEVEGVRGVFLGADFIAVSKQEAASWDVIKPQILASIMDFFLTSQPIFASENQEDISEEEEEPIIKEIKELLDTRIRPAVAMDGGDILFDHFKEGILYVKLQGACSGCPSSSATLKAGIENMLRYYVPEVQEVKAI